VGEEPLIVEVVRSGGLAGLTRRLGPVDASSLSAEDARTLSELARKTDTLTAQRAGRAAMKRSRVGGVRPEALQYDITIVDALGQRSFRVVESSSSHELQEVAREWFRVLKRLTGRGT
jgi:hypothetical protein